MLSIPQDLLDRTVDLGTVRVTAEMIATYGRTVGDDDARATAENTAPPTFCLALRRGMTPPIPLPDTMFGVYGGHDLEFFHPLRSGGAYAITARIIAVYEKMGRTGVLTIVGREALIHDGVRRLAARIIEHQIVRRRPQDGETAADEGACQPVGLEGSSDQRGERALEMTLTAGPSLDIDLGHELGPYRRAGTEPAQISAYVAAHDIAEPLFLEPDLARALGYRGVVVPGPMLTAFLEQFVRHALPGWILERLTTTFRLPTIARESIVLHGVVTERHHTTDGERIVCDLVIDHQDAERAVTGTATLRRP